MTNSEYSNPLFIFKDAEITDQSQECSFALPHFPTHPQSLMKTTLMCHSEKGKQEFPFLPVTMLCLCLILLPEGRVIILTLIITSVKSFGVKDPGLPWALPAHFRVFNPEGKMDVSLHSS